MKKQLLTIALLLLPLVGCSDGGGPGEFDRMVTGLAGGGSGSAPTQAPAQQPNLTGTAGIMAIQEIHGAVNRKDCDKMAARFRRAGRKVKLVDVLPNDVGVGGVLNYKCVFEGEDAQPGWYGQ